MNGNFTRQEIEKRMCAVMAGMLTPDEFDAYRTLLSSLSDEELGAIVVNSIRAYQQDPISDKEIKSFEREILARRGLTEADTVLSQSAAKWMSKEESAHWWKVISKSRPSDSIFLMGKDDDTLCAMWQENVRDKHYIPSDLFFSDKIPLMDCEIKVDERDKPPEENGGNVILYRVVIFEDYKERLERENNATVGALILPGARGDIFVLLNAIKGFDSLLISGFGIHGTAIEEEKKKIRTIDLQTGAYACIATWYGIQISLLHPQLKEIFSRPKTVPMVSTKTKPGKRRKRRTRYIKRHVIASGEVSEILTGSREFTRHTLAWYVIGHWRHYQDGRATFIKGYWKGALRHLKQNLDEGRDRIINLPEGGTV